MARDKICTPFLALASPENKFTVNTIEDMQSRKYLKIGDVVELNGYYTAGDGAHHKRKIESADDGSGVQLANGLWANIVHNGEVNVSWFGGELSKIGYSNSTFYLDRDTVFNSPIHLKRDSVLDLRNNDLIIENLNSTSFITFSRNCKIINGKIRNKSMKVKNIIYSNSKLLFADKKGNEEYGDVSNLLDFRNLIIETYSCGIDILEDTCGIKLEINPTDTEKWDNFLYATQVTNVDILGNSLEHGIYIKLDNSNTRGWIHDISLDRVNFQGCRYQFKAESISNSYGDYGSHGLYKFSNCNFQHAKNTNNAIKFINCGFSSTILECSAWDFPKEKVPFSIGNARNCSILGDISGYTLDRQSDFFKRVEGDEFAIKTLNYKSYYLKNEDRYTDYNFTKDLPAEGDMSTSTLNNDYAIVKRHFMDSANTSLTGLPLFQRIGYFRFNKNTSVLRRGVGFFIDTAYGTAGICNILFTMNLANKVIEGNYSRIYTFEGVSQNFEILYKTLEHSDYIDIVLYRKFSTSFEMNYFNLRMLQITGFCGFNLDIGGFEKEEIFIESTSKSMVKKVGVTTSIQTLNTPYHATKMQQEGVYEDFVSYMDEKLEYDKEQRLLEEQRQLAFKSREDQEQTYEEWLATQPVLIPDVEPQPSQKLLEFYNEYK